MAHHDHGLFSDHCEAEHSCGMEQARAHMPGPGKLQELAGFFKVFADGSSTPWTARSFACATWRSCWA